MQMSCLQLNDGILFCSLGKLCNGAVVDIERDLTKDVIHPSHPEEIRAHFEIGDDEALLMGIALGYPAESKINELKTDRRLLADFLQVKE